MSASGVTQISLAVGARTGAIELTGRANVACSGVFKDVVQHLRDERVERIYIFLKSCLLMDSTFLGVLAKEAVSDSEEPSGEPARIELVQPSERVLGLIENLGVLDSFEISKGVPDITFQFQPVSIEVPADLRELSRISLDAHRALIDLNEENRARFEGVTSLLEQELGEEPSGDSTSESASK